MDKNPVPNVSSKSFDSYIGNGPKPPSPYAKESCRSADGKLQSSSSGFNLSQCSEVLSMNDDDSSVNLIFKVWGGDLNARLRFTFIFRFNSSITSRTISGQLEKHFL